ncbi:hypothetical protein QBC36DRAFT_22194 [Triangularia setosa]|uniref:Uncharacterized protein n=1 Tax=Triangularia setosa TaxID=2587417 RepID=A0AAN6W556_9PEZI|nr:hypothetical protein QBC36DRAFT_22194 [Podospora setosa]
MWVAYGVIGDLYHIFGFWLGGLLLLLFISGVSCWLFEVCLCGSDSTLSVKFVITQRDGGTQKGRRAKQKGGGICRRFGSVVLLWSREGDERSSRTRTQPSL